MHDTPPHDAARQRARRTTTLPPAQQSSALRHPAFLLWLERFAGTRVTDSGREYEVGRAADGLLEARDADGRCVLLRDALRSTTLVRSRLTFDALVAAPPPAPRRASELTRRAERWGAVHTSGPSYLSGMSAGITDLLRLGALVERRGRERDAERARVAALAAWAAAVPSPCRAPEDWAALGTLAAEYARVRHLELYPIPAAFIFRARRHVEERGGSSLLEHRHAHYDATLVAVRVSGGAYELRAASPTGDGQPIAQTCAQLESLGTLAFFACDAEPDTVLGEVIFVDGAEPTHEGRRACVSSPLLLACLQYQLDDFGTAVRIELEE